MIIVCVSCTHILALFVNKIDTQKKRKKKRKKKAMLTLCSIERVATFYVEYLFLNQYVEVKTNKGHGI